MMYVHHLEVPKEIELKALILLIYLYILIMELWKLFQINQRISYAWIKTISLYQWCVFNVKYLEDNYRLLFTHDTELLKLSPKFKLVTCSAKPWVTDIGVHTKSKLISMIASNKLCVKNTYIDKQL
jgi:hypothetical protein